MRLICLAIVLFTLACSLSQKPTPVVGKVSIKEINGQHEFVVDGEIFTIKGVGLDPNDGKNYQALVTAGGNSFRTWRTDGADEVLEIAKQNNLMVAMGLDIEKELHGFDYEDEAAVKHQIEEIKKQVDRYKDHPNLLCWVAGNELNLLFDDTGGLKLVNPKTYTSLKEIVDYIHKVDPNHPVTTTFAGASKEHVEHMLKYCPDIDFLSYQVYGGLGSIQETIKSNGIMIPYLVTEFGPKGHWEMPSTEWGREIEEPSGPKADGMILRMNEAFKKDPLGLNMGGFAFLWGQKQERTPTWYGMFHADGAATSRVDELTKYWTGSYPDNRAPRVDAITLNGLNAVDNVRFDSGSTNKAVVVCSDPDGDEMRYEWVIMKEVEVRSDGGAFEKQPDSLPVEIIKDGGHEISFRAPLATGDYRLFCYVYDKEGKAGDVNIPFFINK